VQDPKKSPKIRHLDTIAHLCRAIYLQLRHVSTIGEKIVKQQYLPHMFSQYGELRPTNGWDPFGRLRHPSKFQLVSRLGSVTARHSSSGHQPNFAALNRGHHRYSTGRPSRWALAHILVLQESTTFTNYYCYCYYYYKRTFGDQWSSFYGPYAFPVDWLIGDIKRRRERESTMSHLLINFSVIPLT